MPNLNESDEFYEYADLMVKERGTKDFGYNRFFHKIFEQSYDLWFQRAFLNVPCLLEAKSHARYVYFILEGTVDIMNKNGHYQYGSLAEGSLFGEFSVLTSIESPFSYFFNHFNEKPLCLLSIEAKDFNKICNNHPLVKEVLIERGRHKLALMHLFKKTSLIKYLKYIVKNQDLMHEFDRSLKDKSNSILRRIKTYGNL